MVNPKRVSWSAALAPAAAAHLKTAKADSFIEWVDALRKSGRDPEVDLEANPAELLPLFKALAAQSCSNKKTRAVTLDTMKTLKTSPALRTLEPMGGGVDRVMVAAAGILRFIGSVECYCWTSPRLRATTAYKIIAQIVCCAARVSHDAIYNNGQSMAVEY